MRKMTVFYGHFAIFLWTFWLILPNFFDFLREYLGPLPYSGPLVSKLQIFALGPPTAALELIRMAVSKNFPL